MVFEKIDRSSWKRNEYFEHYFTDIPCTYSMTVKLDITQIKKKRMKLYPAMLYYLATIVNRHSEFRTAINQAGELGIYDEMIPSYTIFHEDTETFSDLWTEYMPNIEEFSRAYENDIQDSEDGVTVFVLFTNCLVAFGGVCLSSRDDYVRDAGRHCGSAGHGI